MVVVAVAGVERFKGDLNNDGVVSRTWSWDTGAYLQCRPRVEQTRQ